MNGFFGFGQSGGEKAGNSKLDNIFNLGLPAAKSSETAGTGALGDASSYFGNLLRAGRGDIQLHAAPAVNGILDQGDAKRRQEAIAGTGRTGGTAELNHQAGATQDTAIDNIVNQDMVTSKSAAATGEANIGEGWLQHVAQLLGISEGAGATQLGTAISKEGQQSSAITGLVGGAANDAAGLGLAKLFGVA